MKTLWLVSEVIKQSADEIPIGGIYTSEEKAIAACRKNEFIMEFEVNKRLPANVENCIKVYYPKLEKWEDSKLYKLQQKRKNEK